MISLIPRLATSIATQLPPLRAKGLHLWLGSYLADAHMRRLQPAPGPVDVFLCVADHFEPGWGGVSHAQECARVDEWTRRLPELARRHRDADGRPHQHTFFFPAEAYRPEHLERLARLSRDGFAGVEVHLHHDADTSQHLRDTLLGFTQTLRDRHGLLHTNAHTGVIEYAFVHGNWALDNSSPDGRWCGVNDELTVLRETGCYADFTFPSAPHCTQPRKINSIYYATDDPAQPKSHNDGCDVSIGGQPCGDLMLIQGPLMLNWRRRKCGLLPRIENGELSGDNPPSPLRADLWVRCGIHVRGDANRIFIKLHTHGAEEQNFEALLGRPMDTLLSHLETHYNDGRRFRLHYTTARQMYEAVKRIERGDPERPLAHEARKIGTSSCAVSVE